MKTAEVKSALRGRFISPEWSLFFEVGDATGTKQRRWADAVAMNLYPSRGLEVHGFEIKVSRSDWMRELKNPEKSAPVQRFCDRWWIVCPAGIIKDGELPPTWGHYEVKPGGTIRQVVAAPKLESETIDRGFVAALLRRASKVGEDEIIAAVDNRVKVIEDQYRDRVEREVRMSTDRHQKLKERVQAFEVETGLKIDSWRPADEVATAIRLIDKVGIQNVYGGIRGLQRNARIFVEQIDSVMDEFGVDQGGTN